MPGDNLCQARVCPQPPDVIDPVRAGFQAGFSHLSFPGVHRNQRVQNPRDLISRKTGSRRFQLFFGSHRLCARAAALGAQVQNIRAVADKFLCLCQRPLYWVT